MTETLDPKEISQCFKDVFYNKKGIIVLEKLQMFCLGHSRQAIACIDSANQTFYNLGAHAVWRFIQCQLEVPIEQRASDCVIEVEKERN